MPKREMITLLDKARPGFNIHESVGLGGRNKTGDVMLIQAMFIYIAEGGDLMELLGPAGGEVFKIPALTGEFDADTLMSITMFQAFNGQHLVAADLVISPASYHGRKINPFKPLMSITRLHVLCIAAGKKQGDDDYTRGMLRLLPSILPWIPVLGLGGLIGASSPLLKGLAGGKQ